MLSRYISSLLFRTFPKSSQICRSYSAVPLAFNTYQKDENSDKSLIVMHGLFGSKSNWNSLCKAFAQKTVPKRKIFAIDARNHGDTEHTQNHNYELMAEDIREFIEENELAKASILGHSMGGRAVMYLALKYPYLVEKLIVVDISPKGRIGTTQSNIPLFLHAMQSLKIDSQQTIQQARVAADKKLSEIISEKSLRDFLITNLIRDESGNFTWRINLETLDRCFQTGIAQFPSTEGMHFDGPTLFIGGSKSDYLKPADKPEIEKLFPQSTMEFLDAGHWVHAEKSEEFLNLVINFLNK